MRVFAHEALGVATRILSSKLLATAEGYYAPDDARALFMGGLVDRMELLASFLDKPLEIRQRCGVTVKRDDGGFALHFADLPGQHPMSKLFRHLPHDSDLMEGTESIKDEVRSEIQALVRKYAPVELYSEVRVERAPSGVIVRLLNPEPDYP
jgi:hypothetical protein